MLQLCVRIFGRLIDISSKLITTKSTIESVIQDSRTLLSTLNSDIGRMIVDDSQNYYQLLSTIK